MSETIVHIPPSSDCFTRRYQMPPFPSIPNQLNSSISSSSSQCSSDEQEHEVIRSILELEDYMNESTLSVDGEFDVRIDVIITPPRNLEHIHQQNKLKTPTSSSLSPSFATAPPLSDSESDDIQHAATTVTQTQNKEGGAKQETCKETCIICYDDIAEVVTNESEKNVPDFCKTCKYNVHLDCIDEYRVNKLNDAVAERNGASIASSSVGIKCLICAQEVERIHIKRNGDIEIVKTQTQIVRNDTHEQRRLSPEQRLQRDLHAQVLINMERRMRRERRNQCKQKFCNFCFFAVLTMSIAVILIMRFA